MTKTPYVFKTFSRKNRALILKANAVLSEYSAQGFVLTLRQLYYQFVARDWLPNKVRSYKLLGRIVGDARLAGLIDWEGIEDRTRNLMAVRHYAGPQTALEQLAGGYRTDLWADQPYRPEVWIEKDALTGVIADVCNRNDVPYFSCRGYTSLSEMWRASLRLRAFSGGGQTPYITHFGDHDPSGMDMSRDILDRLQQTFLAGCQFVRVALNMEQIRAYNPPPNPAKVTDSRFKAYVEKYGPESWELDSLDPRRFGELIEESLNRIRDAARWRRAVKEMMATQKQLQDLSQEWDGLGRLKADLKNAATAKDELERSLSQALGRETKLAEQLAALKRRRKGK